MAVQIGAAEPEDETDEEQTISTPLLSFKSLKQLAAVPPEVFCPMHLMQGLLAGQVGTRPLVQYGRPLPSQNPCGNVPDELPPLVVPQSGAALPEDTEQIISTPFTSFGSLKQFAALPPDVFCPIHLIHGLFAGHVGTDPSVQYG